MASFAVHMLKSLSPVQSVVLLAIFLVFIYIIFWHRQGFSVKNPRVTLSNYPILGDLGFWTGRHDWWLRAQQNVTSKNFSFHVGKHPIIGTASDEGRKAFFENRGLDLPAGYAVLFGQNPDFSDGEPGKSSLQADNYFTRRITALLKREQFMKALPTMLSDVQGRLNELAEKSPGITDPFESIYNIVYLLTMRAGGATEIATNRKLLDKTLSLYQTIESTATPYQIIFPWLPSPALFKRFFAGTRLYMLFQNLVNERKKTGKRYDDPLQYLIDQGDPMRNIIAFIVGLLFAGQLNSGINAAWVLCYLATSPRWLAEVRNEIKNTTNKYFPGDDMTVTEKLGKLPLEAWESEFPWLDSCLRDSLRLQLHGTGFRKNKSGKDIPIGNGEVVPPDAFLIFHFGEHHQNPEIFSDPKLWDPSRYLPERAEDKKSPYAFVGWGTGRHPCLGMRFAKLESNIITAFFCSMFDFELLDEAGERMDSQLPVNMNCWNASPPDKKVYLKYSLRK